MEENKKKEIVEDSFWERFKKKADASCHRVYLWFRSLLEHRGFLLVAIILSILALAVRYSLMPYPSNDMIGFIFPWIKNFRLNGHLAYLAQMQGDYPPAYMTILALFSYFDSGPLVTSYGNALNYPYGLYDMIMVKSLSFFFDFFLAYGCYKIVKKVRKESLALQFLAFVVPLFLPTICLNSGLWGQCDAIYVSFIVWCVYYTLEDNPLKASIMFGLSLAFKLQAIFILPFLGFLWLRKKFKLRYFFLSLGVVFLTFLPCYAAGAPFLSPFEKYANLTVEYAAPNYNSGSLYSFIQNIFWAQNSDVSTQIPTYDLIHFAGIFFGLACAFASLFFFYQRKIRPTKEAMVLIAAFYAIMIPFVLPHMHERYFYMADIFILLYCLTNKKRYWLILLMQFSSVISYMPFLLNTYFISSFGDHSLRLATIANAVIIAVLLKDILSLPRYEKGKCDLSEQEQAEMKKMEQPSASSSQEVN